MPDPEHLDVHDADYRVAVGAEPPRGAEPPSRRPGERLSPLAAFVTRLLRAKFVFVPLKLLLGGPVVAPALTALISIGAYGWIFGWEFGVGLVALLFIHEMGHVLMLRRFGVRATAPIFIPFLGAFIGMRQLPRDAVMEAYVGLGGPVLGSLGAVLAWGVYQADGRSIWLVMTYLGVLLNLFNLLPLPPLDGGRAVAAISRWLWVVGLAGLVGLVILRPEPVFVLIVLFAATELWQVRRRGRVQPEYYRVPSRQRLAVSSIYFGLAAGLIFALIRLTPMLGMERLL